VLPLNEVNKAGSSNAHLVGRKKGQAPRDPQNLVTVVIWQHVSKDAFSDAIEFRINLVGKSRRVAERLTNEWRLHDLEGNHVFNIWKGKLFNE
jgi:hypothetical protein